VVNKVTALTEVKENSTYIFPRINIFQPRVNEINKSFLIRLSLSEASLFIIDMYNSRVFSQITLAIVLQYDVQIF